MTGRSSARKGDQSWGRGFMESMIVARGGRSSPGEERSRPSRGRYSGGSALGLPEPRLRPPRQVVEPRHVAVEPEGVAEEGAALAGVAAAAGVGLAELADDLL